MNKPELEMWLPIKEFNGDYEVSSFGRVRSVARIVKDKNGVSRCIKPTIMKLQISKTTGYVLCNFHQNAKSITRSVHRLEAITFYGDSDLPVDHIDNDKLNNNLSNLRFATQSENVAKACLNKGGKTSNQSYIHFHKRKQRWVVTQPVTNKTLGYFNTEEEAIEHKLSLTETY